MLHGNKCGMCGLWFMGRAAQRYCSKKCRAAGQYQMKVERRRAAKEERALAAIDPIGDLRAYYQTADYRQFVDKCRSAA